MDDQRTRPRADLSEEPTPIGIDDSSDTAFGITADAANGTPTDRGVAMPHLSPVPQPVPEAGQSPKKIRVFDQVLNGGEASGKVWQRQPRNTGVGAVHVKSFHCKLNGDSLAFMDQQINDWLDERPECEVKLVTTSVGEWSGKTREPALIVNVWV